MEGQGVCEAVHRRLLPTIRREGIQWPTFVGDAVRLGASVMGVSVYCDPGLGFSGAAAARDLLRRCDPVVAKNARVFGLLPRPVNVLVYAVGGVTDGTGGADHMGCDYASGAEIEVCASYENLDRQLALFEAELSECCMGGNLCGVSTGEALSRWCALALVGDVLPDFASAPMWQAQGADDWVDRVNPTDIDYPSIGCGMAFLSWLMAGGVGLGAIAKAMVVLGEGATLATLYERLLGAPAATAWPSFLKALQGREITSDDPFGALPKG